MFFGFFPTRITKFTWFRRVKQNCCTHTARRRIVEIDKNISAHKKRINEFTCISCWQQPIDRVHMPLDIASLKWPFTSTYIRTSERFMLVDLWRVEHAISIANELDSYLKWNKKIDKNNLTVHVIIAQCAHDGRTPARLIRLTTRWHISSHRSLWTWGVPCATSAINATVAAPSIQLRRMHAQERLLRAW